MSVEATIATLVQRLEKVTQRLEAAEKKLEQGGGASAAAASSGAPSGASVQGYEDLVAQYIVPYVNLSKQIAASSGDKTIEQQAALLHQAVQAQVELLKVASTCKKPDAGSLQNLLAPTSTLMQEIAQIRDANRTSKLFNNLSAVSEGIGALGWVAVEPTPGPFVGEMRGSSEFYSNRVLKDFKGKDQVQVDWVAAFNSFLKELQTYIKQNHTTGLVWNPKGGNAPASVGGGSSGGPPPPPGPPPPVDTSAPSTATKGPDMTGLFSAISKGTEISSGLRKVTADMKSKNRTDKTSLVPASAAKPAAATKKAAPAATKPPVFALQGNKWCVEYQVGNKNIVISETEAKQVCYIYKCNNSVIQIKGKVNAITCDDCTKTAVVFDNAVASFELVNCRSMEVQVTGKVPNFAVDKTSGCQIFLSKDSLESEVITSKCSEINVLIPGDSADSDLVEMAIPEQYKTTVVDGKLITETVQHV